MSKRFRKWLPMILTLCMLFTSFDYGNLTAKAEEVTEAAEATEEPGVPQDAGGQEDTQAPEVTEAPEVTQTPEVTEVPEVTGTPEITQTPEATHAPDATQAPEVTDVPEVTETPEATQAPEVTGEPEITGTPEAPQDMGALQAGISYEANDFYTYIVSVKTGMAVQVTGGNTAAVTADAQIPEGKGNLLADSALFQMRRDPGNALHVSFSSKANAWRMLKSESQNGENIIDTNNALKTEVSGWEAYFLTDLGDGTVAIKDGRLSRYLSVADDNRLMVTQTAVNGPAEQFIIVVAKYEPEPEVNAEVYFEHKATGNLVTVDGVVNNGIDVSLPKSDVIPDNAKFTAYYGAFNGAPVVNFQSKQFNTMWKSDGNTVFQINRQTPGGWESVTMVPQGDGTVAFKNNNNNQYISVRDGKMVTPYNGSLTDNEKFILHTVTVPKKVTVINTSNIEGSSITVNWGPVTDTLFTGYEVWRAESSQGVYSKVSAEMTGTTFTDTGLEFGKTYYYVVHTVVGDGVPAISREVFATTLAGNRPVTPVGLDIVQDGSSMKLKWTANTDADNYDVYRAPSKFADYVLLGTVNTTEYTDTAPNADKYQNYYKIVAVNANGRSDASAPTSLEIKTFGSNMIFFAPTDKTASIDAEVARVYGIQKDAQFGSGRYALMFKPGDYTGTAMMQIGFYTQIAGLGKTPLETKLKNLETPAYLSGNNATCNFWRSAENFSIVDTDNNADAYFNFKWAVSQAAPLRRMDIGRKSSFDWWNGWASGGFAADSIFHKEAGSWSQQQYYTRNSVLDLGFYGVNWNGFFQGVTGAPADNWQLGQGSSNYTNIATTPVIREKPFLYLDNGEYKVFVPSLKKDSTGVSWSDGNIGDGTSLGLEQFYIAKEGTDNAATINAALNSGKNILLTPGIYYAEAPIVIKNPNTVILGIGMATIIPTNDKAAMFVDDVDGATVAGIIFDAGAYSDNLMVVGAPGSNQDHSANPTLLADLFFRIGGVHGGVASTDVALVINSDDVIGDHFWIWRADHGDGVGWDLNKARNGLIVNGDDMTMYGLFNEHFQEYVTLWNGNGGRMYFYQNETPYDPQAQADYMSHNGTVKGYAAYKVSNSVDTHYAVGLGIYDVFINTNGASIFLDNAIEVPNKPGVIVENACTVEIANGSGPLVGINSIINGTGNAISTGVGGKGFAREFVLKYQDGVATLMNGTAQGTQPPDDIIPDADDILYIEHKASGNLITVDGTLDHGIDATLPMTGVIPENAKFTASYGKFNGAPVINFESKQYGTMWKSDGSSVFQINKQIPGGWESVTMVPQGDGTVAFKNNNNNAYISVRDGKLVTPFSGTPTDNEKFIIHTKTAPKKVESIEIVDVDGDYISFIWDAPIDTIYTGLEVWRADSPEGSYVKVSDEDTLPILDDFNLKFNTTYYYKIRTVNGTGPYAESSVFKLTTLAGKLPGRPEGLDIEQTGTGMKLTWDALEGATSYAVYRASSRFAAYSQIAVVDSTEFTDIAPNADKYANYYLVQAINAYGSGGISDFMSLEIKLFGNNMIFYADTDLPELINLEVDSIYREQKDAQFGDGRYALMFKPGDYTDTSKMQIGFYTQIAGLGRTPLETQLNNIETPAYLPNNNATCNFWRSAENLSIVDTDNNDSYKYDFRWAVSQAAPLRRMNIERASTFDWEFGWASGGFAADSIFHKKAGSWSQQQYYMRNSVLENGFFGVNWNAFFQGVTGAPAGNWEQGKGSSNYTNIAATPVIREKPFLYLDNGEYKVFVPSLRRDAAGVSWSEGNIGAGASLSLDQFYIAKEGVDNAATINAALRQGKNLLLTPGIYYAEEPILVTNPNTVILGMGMATIIPTNDTSAMIVEDVDGVTVAGIIFDAGAYSDNLLVVGSKNSRKDHSANPTLLADLFFRIGGVHGGVASTDAALEINSDDVIGDHFWIWRADHGDGVGWDLNKARNGLVVNGDDVTLYALFNEHFQEYTTLWNGNGGRTYFYQFETPYDPQNQADYMSHNGTVKGYAAYKVANKVDTHYAVGLGIYDVFIHTGGASIFMDNAIEVPNKPGVIVENACTVEIADGNGPLVGINSIINGTGNAISTGVGGKGFAREFILKYQNGTATLMNGTERGTQPANEPGDEPQNTGTGNNSSVVNPSAPAPITEYLPIQGVEAKATLKIAKSLSKAPLQATVELPADEILAKVSALAASGKLKLGLTVSSGTIASLLQTEDVTRLSITIKLPGKLQKDSRIDFTDFLLDKAILEAARKAKKDVEVSVTDENGTVRFAWTFTGNNLAASGREMTDVNLFLELKGLNSDNRINGLLSTADISVNRILSLRQQGILPAQADVRINVAGQWRLGQQVYLYSFNPSSGKLDTLPHSSGYQVDKDAYLTLHILQGSDYVLLPVKAESSQITSLINQIKVTPPKKTLYVGGELDQTSVIRIELPVTLELEKDRNTATSSDAFGVVTVDFTSSDTKVAEVDSDGTITAKGVGTAEITARIALYSGKTRLYSYTIKVTKPYIKFTVLTKEMKKGEDFDFDAVAYGLDSQKIVWVTSKKSIVVINKKTGDASAKSVGTDYVTAKIGDVESTVKVAVK